jgi:subtilase-type serine protease
MLGRLYRLRATTAPIRGRFIVRGHLSSVSRLALATAAALAVPAGASAADFTYRDGQVVATSLEMPVDGANLIVNEGSAEQAGLHAAEGNLAGAVKTGAGRLILSGTTEMPNGVAINAGSLEVTGQLLAPATVNAGALIVAEGGLAGTVTNSAAGTVINNQSINALTSLGSVINNKSVFLLTANGGTVLNNAESSVYSATVNGGTLTNNGSIRDASVASGASLTNNQRGSLRSLSNNGISSNDGSIYSVIQQGGAFTNDAEGTIYGMTMSGGVASNAGGITYLNLDEGTFTNNEGGEVGSATVTEGGTLLNGGAMDRVSVQAGGALTNNQDGTVDELTNAGTATNAGQIGTVTQTAGSLVNNGSILGDATVNGGTFTNNHALGGATVGSDGTFTNNEDGVARSLSNSGTSSNAGSIRSVSQLAGSLVNEAEGSIESLGVQGGTVTNAGSVGRMSMSGGAMTINHGGSVGQAIINGGAFTNSGEVSDLSLAAGAGFTNNATGNAGRVTSAGTGANAGRIGALAVNAGTFSNSGVIADGLTIAEAGALSSSGIINGIIDNAGRLTLSGIATRHVTNRQTGTLNLNGDLLAGGTLTNDGTLNSEGDHGVNGYTAIINGGAMNIDGALDFETGNLTSSGAIRLNAGATTADRLAVAGSFSLEAPAETVIDVAADGSSDRITAGGDIMLGGRLTIEATDGEYGLRSAYEAFASTAGDIAGTFSSYVVTGVDYLFGNVETDPAGETRVVLRNRDALLEQLDELPLGDAAGLIGGMDFSGADGAAVFDAMAAMDEDDTQGLFAQLTGAASDTAVAISDAAARGFGSLVHRVAAGAGFSGGNERLLAYQSGISRVKPQFEWVAEEGDGDGALVRSDSGAAQRGTIWARGFGETGESGLAFGAAAGAELRVGEKTRVGVSGGYSLADTGAGGTEASTSSFHAGGYIAHGATAPGEAGFGVIASAAYSIHDTAQSRRVTVGALTETATASFGGSTISGEITLRHGFQPGDSGRFTLAPVAGVKFAFGEDDGYTEQGAGPLNLVVSSAKRQSIQGVIGLQAAARFDTDVMTITPHVTALYQHEFADTAVTTTRSHAGSATPFTVTQQGSSRSSIAIEAGIGLMLRNGLSLDLSGYGVMAGGDTRYGGTATVKARF